MTFTDKNYKDLSDTVYLLDPKHPEYNPDLKQIFWKTLQQNLIINNLMDILLKRVQKIYRKL